jgi:hypothetical protein
LADDYEFDEETISKINRLFANYLAYQHFDTEQRGGRKGARDQLTRLAKALHSFRDEWEQAIQNPYVLNAIIDHIENPELRAIQQELSDVLEQCERERKDATKDKRYLSVVERLRKNNDKHLFPLIDLFTQLPGETAPLLKRLQDAVEMALQLPTLDRPSLPTYMRGRSPSRKPLRWLIKGLYDIACRYVAAEESSSKKTRLEFVADLLRIIDLPQDTSTINNILLEQETSQK